MHVLSQALYQNALVTLNDLIDDLNDELKDVQLAFRRKSKLFVMNNFKNIFTVNVSEVWTYC